MVVIGCLNIVGKLMVMMLFDVGVIVMICYSKMCDFVVYMCEVDIVVVVVGKCNILIVDMVKLGVMVIDVGMNCDDVGKLCGDVDFVGVKEVVGYIMLVLGGVGLMIIMMLLINMIEFVECVVVVVV